METAELERRKNELKDILTQEMPLDVLLDAVSALFIDCKSVNPIKSSPLYCFVDNCKYFLF